MTLISITRSSQIYTLLVFINTNNADIEFTCEKEDNISITFLDTRITKTIVGTLHFSVYGKPTSTDRCLDYDTQSDIPQYNINYFFFDVVFMNSSII